MKIRILTNNRSERGPGMVYKNLRKGLELLGVEVMNYPIHLDEHYDYSVCLSDTKAWEEAFDMSDCSLVGPNNWTVPLPEVAAKYQDFLVPSQWVKDFYKTYDFMEDKNLHIWPAGIDTEDWPDRSSEPKKGDCLIYFKGMSEQDKNLAAELLIDRGLSFGCLKYGNYTEDALRDATRQCRFAILVTRTESQGIAYQQILASGLPCFVFEKESWDDRSPEVECPATAVPYFDDRCGVKVREGASREEIYEAFSYFLENLDSFDPRAYIEENLTLEICAQKFLDILESTDDKKD